MLHKMLNSIVPPPPIASLDWSTQYKRQYNDVSSTPLKVLVSKKNDIPQIITTAYKTVPSHLICYRHYYYIFYFVSYCVFGDEDNLGM